MKISFLTFCAAVLAGCASRQVEVTSLRVSPLLVSLEVVSSEPRDVAGRRAVAARVLERKEEWPAIVHLVVDGSPREENSLLAVGRRVRVKFDQEGFDHEKKIGFSFWSYRDLSPQPLEKKPNQSPEPTAPSGRGSS